jgi:Uma2 family endonuclease
VSPSAILDFLDAPDLPEMLDQGSEALRDEQERRREFRNDITPEHKWEFIQGKAIMHSPALLRHLEATGNLYQLLSAYVRKTACGSVLMEKAMVAFSRNDYEPDIVFFGLEKSARFSPDTLLFPVPDLIVEVLSPSTSRRDRGIKLKDYACHGVREYWIIDTVAKTIELHELPFGETVYPRASARQTGLVESGVIVGFSIPVESVFDSAEMGRRVRQISGDEAVAEALVAAEQALTDTQKTLSEKDQALNDVRKTLSEKDQALSEKDQALSEKDQALNDVRKTLSEKDEALSYAQQALIDTRRLLDEARQAAERAIAAEVEVRQLRARLGGD